MRRLFVAFILFASFPFYAYSQSGTWARSYFNSSDSVNYQLKLEKRGNAFDMLLGDHILRISNAGSISFQKKINLPFNVFTTAFDTTREGGFILAGRADFLEDGESTLIKVAPDGNPVWASTLKGIDSFFYMLEILQTRDGGYIAGGVAFPFIPAAAAEVSQQEFRAWLVKFGGHGVEQWQRSFNVWGMEDLRQTRDGGYVFSTYGGSLLKVDKNGDFLWQKKYGEAPLVMEVSRDGGFWLITREYRKPIRLTKTTATGEIQWQKQYSNQDTITDIETLPTGGVLLAGSTKTNRGKPVVYFINSSGNAVWRRLYNLTGYPLVPRILKLSDGKILIAARNYLLKTDENGEIETSCPSFIQTSTPLTLSSSFPFSDRNPIVKSFRLGNRPVAVNASSGLVTYESLCSQ